MGNKIKETKLQIKYEFILDLWQYGQVLAIKTTLGTKTNWIYRKSIILQDKLVYSVFQQPIP